jgi:serine/threonine-protein kinase
LVAKNPDAAALVGQLIADRYRVEALIDEGAMGCVYLAEHVLMQKRVAVKVVRPELTRVPEIVARFEREVRAAANVNHPNVVAAMDLGHLPSGDLFLVLEYIEGQTLRETLRGGPIKPERALAIALQVAEALSAAHAVGIVHRDLKPENVMLVPRSSALPLVKVLDFGVAKVPMELAMPSSSGAPDGLVTKAGVVFGTPDYMSPEQALGKELDGRADLYSLGILLYEMLAGLRPFRANHDFGILGQQLAEGVPNVSDRAPEVSVAPAIEEFVRALLAVDVGARIQSAQEAMARLKLLLDSGIAKSAPTLANPPARVAPVSAASKRPWWAATFRFLPEPFSLIPIWVFASVGLVLLSGVTGLMFAVIKPQAPIRPSAPQTSIAEPGVPAADVEAAIEQGSKNVTQLMLRHPKQAELRVALARTLVKDGKRSEAVNAVAAAVSLSPPLVNDKYVKGVLWDAAQHADSSDAAFALLFGPMGAAGADIAFDLATTRAVLERYASRARQFLATAPAAEVASPALKVASSLLLATNCEQRQGMLLDAAKSGDQRSLTLLQQFARGDGCSALEVRFGAACNACLKDSAALQTAIMTLQSRAAAANQ